MLFFLPLPVREAYESSFLTFKAEVETLLWGSLWGYSSAKAQSFSSRFKRCPLLWRVRKMNRPCLFQGRKNAHTVQQSQIWSSNSSAFRAGQQCHQALAAAMLLELGSTVSTSSGSRSSPAPRAQYTLTVISVSEAWSHRQHYLLCLGQILY